MLKLLVMEICSLKGLLGLRGFKGISNFLYVVFFESKWFLVFNEYL